MMDKRSSSKLHWAGALLGLTFGLASAIAPAQADKVGVAAAVNPDAFSSLGGAQQTQLNIGKSIFFNERINTTTSGLVQVLLVDGSTFTVGPGSDLVIDKFVYDPNKGTGQIAASFSKGVVRFVGGKISKNEGGVTVDTPAGALAIRGGISYMDFKSPKNFSILFVFGEYLKLQGKTLFEPGYGWFSNNGQFESRPFSPSDLAGIMAALTNGNTAGLGAGGTGDNPKPGNKLVETLSLQDLVADATATQVNDTLSQEETTATTPTTVTARVLPSAGVYTAFPDSPDIFTTDSTEEKELLGGGDYEAGIPLDKRVDDFIWTFDIVNGRLTGTVSGLFESHCTDPDCSAINTTQIQPAVVDFPGTLNCVTGVCLVTAADHATVTQNGKIETFQGLAVLKTDFFAYHLIGANTDNPDQTSSDPLLIFGGKGHDFGTPSGKTYAFLLTPDVKEGILAPFAGGASFPVIPDPELNPGKPLPAISPLLYLEQDNGGANNQSKPVWLQTSLYINTTPDDPLTTEGDEFDQQSFVNIALGGVDPNTGGLVGARRGGSSVDYPDFDCGEECGTHRDQIAFTGDIASLAGPDGSHFLGRDDPNIVIGIDTTGTHNIGRDIPLDLTSLPADKASGATYHIGVGLGALDPALQPAQTYDSTFRGYAVGIVQSEVPSSNFVNVVASTSPEDFAITFDKTTNTLSASLTVRDIQNHDNATDAYILGFGDNPLEPANKSAYIDDLHYAAIESANPEETSVLHQDNPYGPVYYQNASATSYLVSGDQLQVTSFFPETFAETSPGSGVRPFCTDCAFMKWGAWGSRVGYDDGQSGGAHYVDNVHLGWWVAGDLSSAGSPDSDLDKLAALNATATYTGHVIGNVANNLDSAGWKTYVAAGGLNMNWNFGPRNGGLTISNFDNRSYSTGEFGLSQPTQNINQFGGSLQQIAGEGMTGNVTGSFMRGPTSPAQGVAGNFNVAGDAYKATGIFAGSGTPVPGPQ